MPAGQRKVTERERQTQERGLVHSTQSWLNSWAPCHRHLQLPACLPSCPAQLPVDIVNLPCGTLLATFPSFNPTFFPGSSVKLNKNVLHSRTGLGIYAQLSSASSSFPLFRSRNLTASESSSEGVHAKNAQICALRSTKIQAKRKRQRRERKAAAFQVADDVDSKRN